MPLVAEQVELLKAVRHLGNFQGQPTGVLQVLPHHRKGRKIPHRLRRPWPQAIEQKADRLNAVCPRVRPANLARQALRQTVITRAQHRRHLRKVKVVVVRAADELRAGVDHLLDPVFSRGLHHIQGTARVHVKALLGMIAHDRAIHNRIHARGRGPHLLPRRHIAMHDGLAVRVRSDVGQRHIVCIFEPGQ